MQTLYDKIWSAHEVCPLDDGCSLLYIDRHLIHEVTSPQAFSSLRAANRPLWSQASVLAVPDHNVPTDSRGNGIESISDKWSRLQVKTLDENCNQYGIRHFKIDDVRQGIVHVISPEQGFTLPGITLVCGDSHTSTHGAFAALAYGIGTTDVEHVLATQCLVQKKAKNLCLKVNGTLQKGLSGKDIILAIIGEIGTSAGTGYTIEFMGEAIQKLSMEGRMTVCNMAIEAGARSGLVAVDNSTLEYIEKTPFYTDAMQRGVWDKAVEYWRTLHSDDQAHFDKVIEFDASVWEPQVTWGTSPEMVTGVGQAVPHLSDAKDASQSSTWRDAMSYMGLKEGQRLDEIEVDRVFIGSCTNARLEDLRSAVEVIKGKKVASNVKQAMVVPGSGLVKKAAEAEGLDQYFKEAGFEWRSPGCSMCLAMNADRLLPSERCASTSNRNFEGRQGYGGRTHLLSPVMAAAAAIAGHFVDVRELL